MSLLTNEQITELVGLASNQSTSKDLHDEFHEWNEKQTTQQIEPDWSKASDNAVFAVVHVTWGNKFGTWLGSHPVLTFERPASVITPHPHAEIMAKYAEVAARRVDPWVEFEARLTYDHRNTWFKMTDDKFFSGATDFEYRHIGETK